MCYDYYHGFDQFRAEYKKAHDKEPYVGPIVQFRWLIYNDLGLNFQS
jgi:hypothetical protein